MQLQDLVMKRLIRISAVQALAPGGQTLSMGFMDLAFRAKTVRSCRAASRMLGMGSFAAAAAAGMSSACALAMDSLEDASAHSCRAQPLLHEWQRVRHACCKLGFCVHCQNLSNDVTLW